MNAELKQALAHKLLALADDELILAHRNSEWTGHAPILEEDIAFSNIAQDELGHATLWYTLLAQLTGQDPDAHPDQLAFFRDAGEYRCNQIVELPKGDWAFTIVRQYLFDAFEAAHLPELARSSYPPLAQAAVKISREEFYHYRHALAWLKRLGLGTAESHRRMQDALNRLWPFTGQLFFPLPDEAPLAAAGYVPDLWAVFPAWKGLVLPALAEANLSVPQNIPLLPGRRDWHTEHLAPLLAEMQAVARLEPPETAW